VIVGIDSMILIYAEIVPSKESSRAADFKDLRDRSKLLLLMAARKKDTILLPTVAISELLIPVPTSQMGSLIAVLQRKFVCPPFDLRAATIAADLWSQHKKLPQDQQYDKRQILRADAMIVASVLAAGATEFYTHDRKCQTLAGLVMTARDLPIRDPDDMFAMRDIAKGEV
jgi:predicted nucleic acid-binding protein